MKKILSVTLAVVILISSVIGVGMITASAEGNPDSFVADFSKLSTQWAGDRTDQLGYNPSTTAFDDEGQYFGNNQGHNNSQKQGAITTLQSYDFGEKLNISFSYTTDNGNGSQNNASRDAYVQVGLFKIILCDFQTRIVVQYNGTDITGESVCSDNTYKSPKTQNYTVSIKKGDIKIKSETVTYTSSFDGFNSVDNAQISVGITETWHIYTSYFGKLTAAAAKSSFSTDFTTANGWTGSTDKINTTEKYFGLNDGWESSAAEIITEKAYSLGKVFDASFTFYTYSKNPSYDPNATLYRIKIGGFEINIKDFQSVIEMKYNGADIGGTTYAKKNVDHTDVEIRNLKYTLHVEPGYIILDSDILTYTAFFDGYESLDSATITLKKIETWHIWTGYFKDFSISGELSSLMIGDVTNDGYLKTEDVSVLRSSLLGKIKVAAHYQDVTRNGRMDILDLLYLMDMLERLGINDNQRSFTADFTSTEGWTGDLAVINTGKGWLGSNVGYGDDDPSGTVTAKSLINLGNAFKSEFTLFTSGTNQFNPNNPVSDTNIPSTGDVMTVKIGDFALDIHDYQNQLKLYYNDTLIGESAKETYTFGWDRSCNYEVYVSKGAISVKQYKDGTLVQSITSDFADFTIQSNAQVSLTKAESWQVYSCYFSSFKVEAVEKNATSLVEDFTSAANWTGDTSKINTIFTDANKKPEDTGAFGESLQTQGSAYSIKSVNEYDFGSSFSGEFTLYNGWLNGSSVASDNVGWRIKIGSLVLHVDRFHNRIALYDGSTLIAEKINSTLNNSPGTYTYKFSFEPNNIVVTQCTVAGVETGLELVINNFDYAPIFGTKVEISKTSTWQWYMNWLFNLSIVAENPKFSVAVDELSNGTLTPDKSAAYEGDTVTVEVSPNTDFRLAEDSLYYSYTENGKKVSLPLTNTEDVYSFTMPSKDVTVTASFVSATENTVVIYNTKPNGKNVAASNGITLSGRAYNTAAGAEYGFIALEGNTAADITVNTANVQVLTSDSSRDILPSCVEYTSNLTVSDWNKSYIVRAYAKAGENYIYSTPKTVSINSAAGLTSQSYVTASAVNTDSGRATVYHNGNPYLFSGVQAQTVRIFDKKLDSEYKYSLHLEPVFKKASELSYDTLCISLGWRNFETTKDNYNYKLVEYIYKYAEQYGLNVQILWFGSNVCGSFDFVPMYIKNEWQTYSIIQNINLNPTDTSFSLDYSDVDLIYREKKAFAELMRSISIYDTNMRTVAIQLENELNATPNASEAYIAMVNSIDASASDIAKYTWVGGQKDAIMSLVNELALLVDNGPYRCVTRINYVSYNCYKTGGAAAGEMQTVLNGTAVDALGVSAYGSDVSDGFSLGMTFNTNPFHIAESAGSAANAAAKMLYATAKSNGLLQYELCYTEGYDQGLAVLNKNGTHRTDAAGNDITAEIIGVNKMLGYFGNSIANTAYADRYVFNTSLSTSYTDANTTQIGYKTVKFQTTTGGFGFAFKTSDAIYLYTNRTSSFIVEGSISSTEIGYLNGDVWTKVAEGTTLTTEQANLGYVIRVK